MGAVFDFKGIEDWPWNPKAAAITMIVRASVERSFWIVILFTRKACPWTVRLLSFLSDFF